MSLEWNSAMRHLLTDVKVEVAKRGVGWWCLEPKAGKCLRLLCMWLVLKPLELIWKSPGCFSAGVCERFNEDDEMSLMEPQSWWVGVE